MSPDWIAALSKMGLWLVALLNVTPVMLWLERRAPAFMQDRLGPNRVGPLGFLQAIADVVKFIFKEDVEPRAADKGLYLLAPFLALVPCLTTFLVIPFGPTMRIGARAVPMVVIDSDVGIFVFLALASLGVYTLVLAGYSSNNKYSLLGSIRASAQMISYELALTLSVVAALVPAGSLNLGAVVDGQIHKHLLGALPAWGVLVQPVGCLVFLVAMFAETNRLPFDLAEAESELVSGYYTEYGSMRFALFFMGEYMSMAVLSCLLATLYFGGWSLPGVHPEVVPGIVAGWFGASLSELATAIGAGIVGFTILAAKASIMMFVFVWVRWTFPRFRYDQLMRLGWKVLLPLALANLVYVAALTIAGKI